MNVPAKSKTVWTGLSMVLLYLVKIFTAEAYPAISSAITFEVVMIIGTGLGLIFMRGTLSSILKKVSDNDQKD